MSKFSFTIMIMHVGTQKYQKHLYEIQEMVCNNIEYNINIGDKLSLIITHPSSIDVHFKLQLIAPPML